jgi:hypothetical protein
LSLLFLQHDIKDTIILVLLAINGRVSQWRLITRVLVMR